MAEEFQGTEIAGPKSGAEESDVDKLIQETLKESRILEKPHKDDASKVEPILKATPFPTSAHPDRIGTQPTTPSPYEATFKSYNVGDIVKGTVSKVDPSVVLVDIGYKAEGIIPLEEFKKPPQVGDKITVSIERLEDKQGSVVLSKTKAEEEVKWKSAFESYKDRKAIEVKVASAVKGGLVVDYEGIRAFIPASQISKSPEETLESFVGKTLPVKVIQINRRIGKIVMSHRLAAGEKPKPDTSKILEEIEVGQVRKGKVASLKSFGAFVDLGGIEGLIHLTELSWKRVKHPSEVLKVGDEIEVFVLGVDKINKKVSLGLKELQQDPWAEAADLYKAGQVVKVKILRFAKFGAFVEISEGLEGLIHISEMSLHQIREPGEVAKIGDIVEAKILRIVPDEQKIGLSIKEVLLNKTKEEQKKAAEIEKPKVTIAEAIKEKEEERKRKQEEETEETEDELS